MEVGLDARLEPARSTNLEAPLQPRRRLVKLPLMHVIKRQVTNQRDGFRQLLVARGRLDVHLFVMASERDDTPLAANPDGLPELGQRTGILNRSLEGERILPEVDVKSAPIHENSRRFAGASRVGVPRNAGMGIAILE
jgi:hypothetical protein